MAPCLLRLLPSRELADLVESIDFMEPGYPGRWILPNAAIDLAIGIDSGRDRVFAPLPPYVLHCYLTWPYQVPPHTGFSATAIRFRPGALRWFFAGNALQLTADSVGALSVFPNVDRIDRILRTVEDPAERRDVVVKWLLSLRKDTPPVDSDVVEEVLDVTWASLAPPTPGEMRRHLGCRERTFQRLMHRTFGVSYRSMMQVSRLNFAFKLRLRQGMGWAESAVEAGFCDQPDFIRTTRKVFGASPTEVERGVEVGAIHVRWPRPGDLPETRAVPATV